MFARAHIGDRHALSSDDNYRTSLGPAMRSIVLYAVLSMAAAGPVDARTDPAERDGAIDIRAASVHLRAHVYRLNADIVWEFSSAAAEALGAGVALTVMVETRVNRERPLFDERVSATETRYVFHKHTLSGQYLLTELETGRTQSFTTIEELVETFGRLREYPMVAKALVPVGHRYRLRLKVRLDIESLPPVLRPLAYLNSGWRMNSGWHSWRLEQ